MFIRLFTKLALLFALASVLLAPGSAWATGEKYVWPDATTQTINASGGAYSSPAKLNSVAGNAGSYSGGAQIDCRGVPTNVTVAVNLTGPTAGPGVTSGATVAVTGCSNSNLDQTVQVLAPSAAGAAVGSTVAGKKCDQGVFSWVLCPIMDKLQETITDIVTKVVEPILRVNAISPASTPSLYSSWTHARNLANILLIIIFLFIVGANVLSFGLDSYSIKRALPRLVVAAIAIQFSFAICSLLVDMSNIVGAGIGDFIQGTTQATSSSGGAGTVIGNVALITVASVGIIVTVITSAALAIPLLIGFLIGIFAFFLTLGARLLLIAVLIVLAPLAIIAYVLPNTQSYYKQWFKLFTRLLLMYPIIMGLLGVAGRINEILSFTTNTASNAGASTAISILKPFIFLYLFLLIPKTFKWAGSWMTGMGAVIAGAGALGISRHKDSQYYKDAQQRRRDRQLEYTRRLAGSKPITSLQSKGALGRGASRMAMGTGGFIMGGAPSTGLAYNRAYSKQVNDYKKELDDLSAAHNPGNVHTAIKAAYGDKTARATLSKTAPSLMHYTETQAGRMAMFAKLADNGFTTNEDFEQVRQSGLKSEYGLALAAAGKNYGKQPAIIPRMAEDKADYEIKDALKRKLPDASLPGGVSHARALGDVDINTVKGMVARWSAAALADDEKVSGENFAVAADTTKAGREFSYALAESAPISEFNKAYDPKHRNFMGLGKRLNGLKMLHSHQPVFQSGRGQLMKESILEHLQHDNDLLIEGLQEAGLSRDDAVTLASTNPAAAEARIKSWIG